MKEQSHPESGNVAFIILLAIALFAALSFALTQNRGGNASLMTEQQAKIVAQEIISYGNTVANAVQKMKLNGVADTQFSFENTVFLEGSSYITGPGSNPNCTTNACKVFAIGGGDVTAQKIGPKGVNLNFAGPEAGVWVPYSASHTNVGSSSGDLFIGLAKPTLEVCRMINNILGVAGPNDAPPLFTANGTLFTGTYNNGAFGTPASMAGKTEYCYEITDHAGWYVYMKVLLAR